MNGCFCYRARGENEEMASIVDKFLQNHVFQDYQQKNVVSLAPQGTTSRCSITYCLLFFCITIYNFALSLFA